MKTLNGYEVCDQVSRDAIANLSEGNDLVVGTTEFWNSQKTLIGIKGRIYVYQDTDSYRVKIGDGSSYLIDNPFIDDKLDKHMSDTIAHVTATEKAKWNNKVSCALDTNNTECLVFSSL